ncbi:MAG: hypothetical protein ACOCQR_01005 [bacterium]
MNEYLNLINNFKGSPKAEALWASLCVNAYDRERAWIKMLLKKGVKAAHPDDGWVNRKDDYVNFAYPQFNMGVEEGDLIALGWSSKNTGYRIVEVVAIKEPFPGEKCYFFKEIENTEKRKR